MTELSQWGQFSKNWSLTVVISTVDSPPTRLPKTNFFVNSDILQVQIWQKKPCKYTYYKVVWNWLKVYDRKKTVNNCQECNSKACIWIFNCHTETKKTQMYVIWKHIPNHTKTKICTENPNEPHPSYFLFFLTGSELE